MANPNLLNATSIYGKNVTVTADGSLNTILTCPTDKIIKIISIIVHNDNPPQGGQYTLGSFYLTEGQTVKFQGDGSGIDCVISYEEIDDA